MNTRNYIISPSAKWNIASIPSKNVSWIGPNILSDFAKSTYSEEERRELWRQDLTFIRDPDHPPYKRYVLVSNYVGGEEDVVDEPDTYEACFALLMRIVQDELRCYPGDQNVVRTCLQSHRIDGVTYADD